MEAGAAEIILKSYGLVPMTWEQVLSETREKLAPSAWREFQKRQDIFVRYGSEENLARYYGFVYKHGLQGLLACYRFHRIRSILCDLAANLKPELRILDVGAGAGYLASIITDRFHPRSYVVQDIVPEIRDYLARKKFAVLPHPPPKNPPGQFDLILCVDSLGELNSDDNDDLEVALDSQSRRVPELLEDHYGFAHKLETWKAYLAPDGKILIWEPFSRQAVWNALAPLLQTKGWKATPCGSDSEVRYLKLVQ